MNLSWKLTGLYPILDLEYCEMHSISIPNLIRLWEEYPKLIDCFQIRSKTYTLAKIQKVYEDCRKWTSLKILVNDYWKSAIDWQADGLHLGKEDYSKLHADEKELLKSSTLWKGTSSHSLADLNVLEEFWDYTGFGPIFPTSTKDSKYAPLGLETLRKAIQQTSVPLVPIGGIQASNFDEKEIGKSTKPAGISCFAEEESFRKFANKMQTWLDSNGVQERVC